MKIAFILPSLHQSGPGIQVRNLISPLINRGADIQVFYLRDMIGENLKMDVVECQKIDLRNLKQQFSKFDIIHSNGFYPDIVAVLIRLKNKNIKIVTSLHNFINEDFNNRYGPVKAKMFSQLWFFVLRFIPNKFVFTNVAKEYYKNLTNGDIYVSGSGVAVTEIKNLCDNSSSVSKIAVDKILDIKKKGYKIIGSTSIISKVKGLDTVIRGLVSLDDYVAVFVGGGPQEKSLIDLSIKLGVSDRVFFLGFQKNPIYFMRYFDVYAMTSSSESFGLSLFEAIACRVPIVCNQIPVFIELLDEHVVCFFDGTPENFAAKIKESYNDNKSNNAYKYLLQNYDVTVISKKYFEFYEELISR